MPTGKEDRRHDSNPMTLLCTGIRNRHPCCFLGPADRVTDLMRI